MRAGDFARAREQRANAAGQTHDSAVCMASGVSGGPVGALALLCLAWPNRRTVVKRKTHPRRPSASALWPSSRSRVGYEGPQTHGQGHADETRTPTTEAAASVSAAQSSQSSCLSQRRQDLHRAFGTIVDSNKHWCIPQQGLEGTGGRVRGRGQQRHLTPSAGRGREACGRGSRVTTPRHRD